MAYFLSKNFWLDLIFPVRCLSCDQENINRGKNKVSANKSGFICTTCLPLLRFSGLDHHLKINNVDETMIASDYDQTLIADLIKKMKFRSLAGIAEPLADLLAIYWQGRALFWPGDILVIPLPLSNKRRRQRGFNQAELLARHFASDFNYNISLDLKKIKHTKPQSSLSGKKRVDNLRGAFHWSGQSLDKKTIILIDDVITTGATMAAAAQVIKNVGAEKIIALAVAKG